MEKPAVERAGIEDVTAKAITVFQTAKIPAFEPGEEEYERCVATSNLLFRFSRPDYVVLPENVSHVQAIIKRAREDRIKITIKCGGHSLAGHSTAFEGISLDLRRMHKVNFDKNARTVFVEAGCQWGHVYKTLVNGKHDGLIINGGRCPYVGVSGFILGGGLGPFTRSVGMGCDTLLEATVVTADGDVVVVKESDLPDSKEGKLFWALRGAGGGNFGVLVNMTLKVEELKNRDIIAGRYEWYPKSTDDFMTTMNDFYTTNWPKEMTIDSTWICDLRTTKDDGVRFLVYYDGSEADFQTLMDEHITETDLAKQLKRRVLPESSTRFLHETLVAQWSEETVRAFPTNKTYSIYSSFSFKNDLPTIKKITAKIRERMRAFRGAFSGEKVEFLVTWIHTGGKAGEREPMDTAFFWREAVYHAYVTVEWEDKWMEREMRDFLATVKDGLRRFSLDGQAAYVNFPDGALSKDTYGKAYFGDNYEDLRRIKKIWDKDNFFDWVQGVKLPENPVTKSSIQKNTQSFQLRPVAADVAESIWASPIEKDLTDSIAGKQWASMKTKKFPDWEPFDARKLAGWS